MQKLSIQGGNKLCGEIKISGAKNAALPILAACLLTSKPVRLTNVPQLADVTTMLNLLNGMGAKITLDDQAGLTIDCADIHDFLAPYELVKTMRASILVLGPLLSRFKEAVVSLPGGCAIGARPVNLHIDGLLAMGANVNIENGYIHAKAPLGLHGSHLHPEIVTVTGTENLMMAAVLAKGQTIIDNAACEPEVIDLALFLNKLGAKISGIGTDTLVIEGVDHLHGGEHHIISDRIEAGTYLVAALATGGEVSLMDVQPCWLTAILEKLEESGARIYCESDKIHLKSPNTRLKAVNISTAPYPGFPTDMQAQFMALNVIAEGRGLIVETIFENRFMHALELKRLGANIEIKGNKVISYGCTELQGASVMATDLRASAGLVIAGLSAKGETIIERIYHIDRGYERIEEKLAKLGASIQRIY